MTKISFWEKKVESNSFLSKRLKVSFTLKLQMRCKNT